MVLNAANDVAVQAYLEEQIPFGDIPRIIAEALERHHPSAQLSLDEILDLDLSTRRNAEELIHQWSPR